MRSGIYDYSIKKDKEHYLIYENGKFIGSADTHREASEMIAIYKEELSAYDDKDYVLFD